MSCVNLLLVLKLKLTVFEHFFLGFILAELEEPNSLFELFSFLRTNVGFELFLDAQGELFAFGLSFDDLAKRAGIRRGGLMGDLFIAFAVE